MNGNLFLREGIKKKIYTGFLLKKWVHVDCTSPKLVVQRYEELFCSPVLTDTLSSVVGALIFRYDDKWSPKKKPNGNFFFDSL
jgi:hypothetical protein